MICLEAMGRGREAKVQERGGARALVRLGKGSGSDTAWKSGERKDALRE